MTSAKNHRNRILDISLQLLAGPAVDLRGP